MEPLVHGIFLLCTLAIAALPLAFTDRAGGRIWLAWAAFWGGLASLTALGVFAFHPQILRLATHFGGQIALGVTLFALVPQVRQAVRAVPLRSLVGLQMVRVIGGFFLIGAAMEEVSWTFALIAGTGDILVGIAALRSFRAMGSGTEAALARRHTFLGLSDFTTAIGTAILTGATIGGPYILIPLFLVPMAVLAHLAVLDRVGLGGAPDQGQVARPKPDGPDGRLVKPAP